ncbi:hypothetical protein ACFQGT_11825 [Natrialbaceae archaeon GCM10025810]|uniref:hypothetical protein n=1 Tax=Halovalidus salilacus TaxID=3075124 RepID=UPI003611122D
MDRRELSVQGTSVNGLPEALYEELLQERKGSVERYDGDGFDVIVVERYYARNNSDQQATIIFDVLTDVTTKVTILSGGGGTGPFLFNLGSHRSQTKKLANQIIELCESDELQLDVTL